MTMQMPDTFLYCGKQVETIAISTPFVFSPLHDFGIKTISWMTANHRGFWCDYVLDQSLKVHTLYLYSKDEHYPILNGIQPVDVPVWRDIFNQVMEKSHQHITYCGPMEYDGIDYDVDYTGMIVIGSDANRNRHERYRKVLQLEYERGILVKVEDITRLWQQVKASDENDPSGYWWTDPRHSYFELINYYYMGTEHS